jgi:hypothetical protein
VGTVKRKRVRLAMIAFNSITLVVILSSMVVIYVSSDLDDYFGKQIYKAFVLFDSIENVALGMCISVYILKLRSKLSVDNKINSTSHTLYEIERTKLHNRKMLEVTNKLSLMLFIFMLCFVVNLIRVCWWILPSNNRYEVDVLAPQSLAHFDFWWWLGMSLLPRVVPSFVFVSCMGWPSKHLFRTLIPDSVVAVAATTATATGGGINPARPRQQSDPDPGYDEDGDEEEERRGKSLRLRALSSLSGSTPHSSARSLSVESDDDGAYYSNIFRNAHRSSLNDDLLPHHHHHHRVCADLSRNDSSYSPPSTLV